MLNTYVLQEKSMIHQGYILFLFLELCEVFLWSIAFLFLK